MIMFRGGLRRPPVCRSSSVRRRRPGRLDAVICDVTGVVIHFGPRVPARIEAAHGLGEGSLLAALRDGPTAISAQAGVLGYQRWLQFARQALSPRAVTDWLEHHGELNQPVACLVTSVALAGVRLFFLANSTARLHTDLAHHGLTDLAERTYTSADIGLLKPDPRAFEFVLRAEALHPARTLVIDACPAAARAARTLGMRVHRYVDAAQLHHELTRAGVAL